MTETVHLNLPELEAGQAQKHVTHNEALGLLDALTQLAVIDRDLSAPPATPAEGDRYIVAGTGSGAWSGHGGNVATWLNGAWVFRTPRAGWLAYAVDEALPLYFTGPAWATLQSALTALQNLALLGVNTTADATNKLSIRSPAVLHTAVYAAGGGSGDARHKLNKETAANTASLLFQTAFSGRAEIGLTGDDSLHVKVSADGATFYDAMCLKSSGAGLVGIGTTAPLAPLHIDSAGNPGAATSPSIMLSGSANKERFELRSAGSAPNANFQAKGFGGTIASPTATQNANRLLGIVAGGYDGSALVQNASAITLVASENWTPTANGSEIAFRVTASGTSASAGAEVLRILNTGQIKFTSAASFAANGAVATALSAVGPSGANTTVQEWLAIKNAAGTTRYIPCF